MDVRVQRRVRWQLDDGISHSNTEKWTRETGFEEDDHELGLKHMACEVSIGHVRWCPLANSTTLTTGWEVEAKRICMKRSLIRDSIWWACLLFGRYNSLRFILRTHTDWGLIMCPALLSSHISFPSGRGTMTRNHLGKLTFQRQIIVQLNTGCSLASPTGLFKTMKPRTHARSIKSESQVVGSRKQYFLKLPGGSDEQSRWRTTAFTELYFQSILISMTESKNPSAWETCPCGWSPGLCTKWSVSGNNSKVWGLMLPTHYILQARISSVYLYWILQLPKHKHKTLVKTAEEDDSFYENSAKMLPAHTLQDSL